jgi:hypothetical protein
MRLVWRLKHSPKNFISFFIAPGVIMKNNKRPKFKRIPRDLFANVGKTLAAWNECEDVMCEIISELIKGPNRAGKKIGAMLGNDGRVEIVRHCSQSFEPELKQTIAEFLSQYSICLENRNLVSHAHYLPSVDNVGHFLKKYPKGSISKQNFYSISTKKIIQVVDDCTALHWFGFKLWWFIYVQDEKNHDGWLLTEKEKHPALPDIPARPSKLAPYVEPD